MASQTKTVREYKLRHTPQPLAHTIGKISQEGQQYYLLMHCQKPNCDGIIRLELNEEQVSYLHNRGLFIVEGKEEA
jgi:hypothetical protein